MTDPRPSPYLLRASDIAALPERAHVHQFNSNALRMTRTISEVVGMSRIGVHIIRVPPGHDTTTFHYHDAEEEFLYILAGRGIADIGDERIEVGAGDFMGFPPGSAAHGMHNPFSTDLVYLVAGDRPDVDVVHYPRLARSMVKRAGRKWWANDADLHEVPAAVPTTPADPDHPAL